MYIDRQVGLGCRRQLSREKKDLWVAEEKNKQCRTEQQQKSLETT